MNKQKTIFLDLDGVCADWIAYVNARIPTPLNADKPRLTDDDIKLLENYPRMYALLPKMPLADDFVAAARQFRDGLGYQLQFLTAVPAENNMPWVFHDKIEWVHQHYPDIPVWFGPYPVDKQLRSAPGNILVDDNIKNCNQWRMHGGTEIYVPTGAEHVGLAALQSLFRALNSECESMN